MAGELNVFGTFQAGPWKNNTELQKAVDKREWSPATAELKMAASSGKGAVEGAVNCFNLLCAIIRNKPDRVNIFSHANEFYLYFSGTVVPGNVNWDTRRPENWLDVDYLDNLEKNGVGFKDGRTKNATFEQFRKALPAHSTICLYACHAALGGELCKGIAKYFRANVKAFSDEVRYYPTIPQKGPISLKYAIGNNEQVSNFHELDRYFSAPITP